MATSSTSHFTPGNITPGTQKRRPGGPKGQSECLREEKNVLAVPGIKPCIIQPTA